jgi:hypothetical protein
MMKKLHISSILTILLVALSLLSCFAAVITLGIFDLFQSRTTLFSKSPRLETKGGVTENENAPCWIKGRLKAKHREDLVSSRGTETRCAYYSYRVEYTKQRNAASNRGGTPWNVFKVAAEFASIPFLVDDREYSLPYLYARAEGRLVRTLDRIDSRGGATYHYTEDIIPDDSEVWILGIPAGSSISRTEIGVVISMDTPEEVADGDTGRPMLALACTIGLVVLAGGLGFLAWRLGRH